VCALTADAFVDALCKLSELMLLVIRALSVRGSPWFQLIDRCAFASCAFGTGMC
jgi:hypothetical protein